MFTHRADRDELVGMVHHRDEKVEQDDDVDYGKCAEHYEAPESREFLNSRKLKIIQVYQTKGSPEQSL